MKKYMRCIVYFVLMFMCFTVRPTTFAQVSAQESVVINFLDRRYVGLIKTKYIDIEGVPQKLGESEKFVVENCEKGRKLIESIIEEPFLSAVMLIWGSSSRKLYMMQVTDGSKSEGITVNESIRIDFLNDKSVAFLKTKSTVIDGKEYQLGEPWAVSFENSAGGRESLCENISEPFLSAVMAV